MKADFRIPLLFLFVGLLWISFSDYWLYSLPFEEEQQLVISNIKGYLFISLSALMLYFLGKYNNRKLLKEQRSLKLKTEENRRLFDVLNKVKNFIVFSDSDAKITWVNQAFENHTGYLLKEIKGKYQGDILKGPETSLEILTQIDNAVMNKAHCTVELLNYNKYGENYWVSLQLAPIFNGSSKFDGFLSIQTDITKSRILHKKLLEQNDLLRKITWMTSHEIRRPLSSIMSLIELVKTGTQTESKECLPLLFKSTEDLDEIIRAVNKQIYELDSKATEIDGKRIL